MPDNRLPPMTATGRHQRSRLSARACSLVAWQYDSGEHDSYLFGASVLADGSVLLAGYEETATGDTDCLAFSLDPEDGAILWQWTVRPYPAGSNGMLFASNQSPHRLMNAMNLTGYRGANNNRNALLPAVPA